MSGRFHLFVYGTLRSNGSASSLLADSELIGAGTVGGILYDIDDVHPALVTYGTTPVRGEVWSCPAWLLRQLDDYEGVAEGLFRRIGAEIALDDGRTQGCWVYVAGPKLAHKLKTARRIEQWA